MSWEGSHPFVNISLFYVLWFVFAAVSSSDCVVFNDRVSSK